MNDDKLIERIIAHEGTKKFAYQDSEGYWSIAIGRCIDSRIGAGLSIDEQMFLLNNDIKRCRQELCTKSFYSIQDIVRKDALVELCFNLGIDKLLKFTKMLSAMQDKNYSQAAIELNNSLWAKQVQPLRVQDLLNRIKYGRYTP
jgi:lysozyme